MEEWMKLGERDEKTIARKTATLSENIPVNPLFL